MFVILGSAYVLIKLNIILYYIFQYDIDISIKLLFYLTKFISCFMVNKNQGVCSLIADIICNYSYS